MKRPLALTALWLLAGVLCGIGIVPAFTRTAVCILAIVSILWMLTESRGLEKGTLFFLFTLAVITFLTGFFRGKNSFEKYESPALDSFYEKYEATNPGEFDYALYLKGMGITCEEEREKAGQSPFSALEMFREYLGGILDEYLTEQDAGICHAMLLGDKTMMDPEIKSLYQTSGIAHLLAVSGLHISLIGMGLFGILRKKLRLSMNLSIALSVLCTAGYVSLTGASASAVRAGIMLSCNLIARKKGRTYDLLSALSLAFLYLLFKEPYVVFLSGFQLSFGAMTGIWMGSEVTMSLYTQGTLKKRSALLASFISSLSVTLVTLPVTLSNYYFFPPYSVLLNLAVIPVMTVLMMAGISVLLCGAFGSRFLCILSAGPVHAVLLFYEWICTKTEKLPFARVITGKPGEGGILLYYAALFLVYAVLTETLSVRRKSGKELRSVRRKKGLFRIGAAFCAVCAVGALWYRKPQENYVAALDVGQGDCFHIHEGDLDILVDGGSSGYDKVGENVIEPYLLSKGIRKLDLIIVSHADSDHTNGIRYLLTTGVPEVRVLMLPAPAQSDPKYDDLRAGSCGTVSYLQTGDRISAGEATLTCLYAGEKSSAGADTNRQSDVMLLEQGSFSMLFTGDMTKEDEWLLLGTPYGEKIRNIDVLKVAHHGSKTASGSAFLERVSPEYALLSYRKNNRFGHPHKETVDVLLNAGAKLLRTPETGAVKIRIGEDGYEIECFRKPKRK